MSSVFCILLRFVEGSTLLRGFGVTNSSSPKLSSELANVSDSSFHVDSSGGTPSISETRLSFKTPSVPALRGGAGKRFSVSRDLVEGFKAALGRFVPARDPELPSDATELARDNDRA